MDSCALQVSLCRYHKAVVQWWESHHFYQFGLNFFIYIIFFKCCLESSNCLSRIVKSKYYDLFIMTPNSVLVNIGNTCCLYLQAAGRFQPLLFQSINTSWKVQLQCLWAKGDTKRDLLWNYPSCYVQSIGEQSWQWGEHFFLVSFVLLPGQQEESRGCRQDLVLKKRDKWWRNASVALCRCSSLLQTLLYG